MKACDQRNCRVPCVVVSALLLLLGALNMGAANAIPKVDSAEDLRAWVVGTKWRNSKNGTIRIFEDDGMRRERGDARSPFRALDAKRLEVEQRTTLIFTFDDEYRTFTSSYRDQRFDFMERLPGEPRAAVASPKTKPAKTKQRKKKGESIKNASWRDAAWVRPAIVVVGFLPLFGAGSLVDYRQRPRHPHESFPELSQSDDRLEKRSTTGAFALCITSVFGGIGLLFCIASPMKVEGVFWLFPVVFTAVGLLPAGLRNAVVIDRGQRTVTTTSTFFLVPFGSHSDSLADVRAVRIEEVVSRSTSDGETHTSKSYPVSLQTGDEEGIEFTSRKVYSEALARGAHIAKWLGIDLRDTVSGQTKSAAELDQSLKERLQAEGVVVDLPTPPKECRITMETHGQEMLLDLPGRQGAAVAAQKFSKDLDLPASLRGALDMADIFASDESSTHVDVDAPKPKTPNDEQIRVSPAGLSITITDAEGSRVEEYQADEIEDLRLVFKGLGDPKADRFERRLKKMYGADVSPEVFEKYMGAYRAAEQRSLAAPRVDQDALLLRSERGTLEFARGLTQAEARWLYDLLRYLLSR